MKGPSVKQSKILNGDLSDFHEQGGRYWSEGAWRTKEQIIKRLKNRLDPEFKRCEAIKASEMRKIAKAAICRA